jgi:hypothetical protein
MSSEEQQLQTNINAILAQTPGSVPLEQCTSDQRGYIIQYGMDMIRNGNKPEFAAQVCAHMAILIQTETLSPLAECTPEQQAFMEQYKDAMIMDGNKPEFAAQVCASMAILYQSRIEQHIPAQITIEDNQTSGAITQSITDPTSVVFAPRFIAQRAVATKRLADVMNANGADYGIISDYLKQQRFSSWNPPCRVIKYFLLQQRTNWEQEANTVYYFEGNKRKQQNIGLPKLQEACTKHFKSANPAKYAKTVAMYKAYTAIALRKTQFEGKDSAQRTCQLQRAMTRSELITRYKSAYENVRQGEIFNEMKGGIADSAALGSPVYFFTQPQRQCDIHEMLIPFFRIHAAYFISPELCYDDVPQKKYNVEAGYGGGHEFVCDFSRLPVKLIHQSS